MTLEDTPARLKHRLPEWQLALDDHRRIQHELRAGFSGLPHQVKQAGPNAGDGGVTLDVQGHSMVKGCPSCFLRALYAAMPMLAVGYSIVGEARIGSHVGMTRIAGQFIGLADGGQLLLSVYLV
jgi:hypothetical protein